MSLPSDLLRTLLEGNGRVVFVLGAGCSVEPPTCLDPASKLAVGIHDRLVGDGILARGECGDPEDLEALVDLVATKEGKGKKDVVVRMPRDRFRNARSNLGHRILVALLQERLVGNVLTTNFDLAIQHAVVEQRALEVTSVRSPEQHGELGNVSVIYLHGNVDSPEDDWVLTSAEVTQSWRGGWRDVVANRVLTAPTVVFVGVGTLVGVLLDSIRRIREAIPDGVNVYQVDPTACEGSNVFAALQIPEDSYIQSGWCDFAEELGKRVNQHHLDEVRWVCAEELDGEELPVRLSAFLESLAEQGLLRFGQIRALWFLEHPSYVPWTTVRTGWIADLLAGVVRMADHADAEIMLDGDNHLTLETSDGKRIRLGCVHGRGEIRWSELDARVAGFGRYRFAPNTAIDVVLAAGVTGPRLEDLSPPRDLADDRPDDDVLTAGRGSRYLDIDDDPEAVWEGAL